MRHDVVVLTFPKVESFLHRNFDPKTNLGNLERYY